MNLEKVLQQYFQGEMQLGIGLALLSAALCAAAFWVWRTQTGAFMWCLFVPLLLIGLGFGGGGTALAIKTRTQVAALQDQLKTEPVALISGESKRMERVNANWPRAKTAWAALAAIAIFFILIVRRDWSAALGLSLMLLATVLFFVDVFAERRAKIYTSALEQGQSVKSDGNTR
jgi:hypothetical protein